MNTRKEAMAVKQEKPATPPNGSHKSTLSRTLAEAKFHRKILQRKIRHGRILLKNRAERKTFDELLPSVVYALSFAASRISLAIKGIFRAVSIQYGRFDSFISRIDARLLDWQNIVLAISATLRLSCEGLLERQPIRFIKRNGDLVTKEGRVLAFVDLSGLSKQELTILVNELHEIGPAYPYKLIWEGAISGAVVADHISWLLEETEKNRHKYLEFSPNAKLGFDTLRGWYLEVAEAIRRGHRVVRPYLVVSKRALKGKLASLAPRQLGSIPVSLYLLGLMDTLSEWDEQPFREAQEKSRTQGFLAASLPDKLDFYQQAVPISKNSLWPDAEGKTERRKVYAQSIKIYAPTRVGEAAVEDLRKLLLPLITHEDRRFYISLVSQAVPLDGRARFLRFAKKDMRILSGFDRVRRSIPPNWSYMAEPDREAALAPALESVAKARYVASFENTVALIPSLERSCFRTSPITLVVKTSTLEDLKEFRKETKQVLKNANIWFEDPEDWPENELNLYNVLPSISEREVSPDVLNIPVWQDLIADNLFAQVPYVPKEGIFCGILEEDGTPLGFDLTIVGAQGTPSSGKTMAAKVLAAFFRLADPERRVIVFDNTVAAQKTSKDDNVPLIDEAAQQGWVQWAELTGGKVIYSALYNTPLELVSALESAENERFLVYYPDRAKKQHDLAALGWVLGAMRRFSQSGGFGEYDLQQMVVFDDILPWDSDISTPDNPGRRMETLTKDVLTQCISTGSLAFLTLQTARAIQLSDPSSHEVITTDVRAWLNFVTPGHGDVAGSIGMRPFTREGESLMQKVGSAMAAITPLGSGSTRDPGRCVVTFHNIGYGVGRILVHPQMLPILSRKAVK